MSVVCVCRNCGKDAAGTVRPTPHTPSLPPTGHSWRDPIQTAMSRRDPAYSFLLPSPFMSVHVNSAPSGAGELASRSGAARGGKSKRTHDSDSSWTATIHAIERLWEPTCMCKTEMGEIDPVFWLGFLFDTRVTLSMIERGVSNSLPKIKIKTRTVMTNL